MAHNFSFYVDFFGLLTFFIRLYTFFSGVDFQMKRLIVDGEPTVLQLWDTAGQERLVILCTYVISVVLFLKGICFFSSKWEKKKSH